MSHSLAFILSCLSAGIMGVMMPAHAAIVISNSFESTAMLDRSLLASDSTAPGSWTGSENAGGSAAFRETPPADGVQYDFLQACCSGVSLTPGISHAPADLDTLAYADYASPPESFSVMVMRTLDEATVLIAADTTPTPGREPYVMLIIGLSLLGLAAALYPKSANKVPAETRASHFSGWNKREPRSPPPSTDVPSRLNFT